MTKATAFVLGMTFTRVVQGVIFGAVMLQRAIKLLEDYNRPISITVALIFGFYFTWDGLKGLLGQ